ncbi:MAG: hypothetical protein C5B60_02465 [Chloroflexi bacterium]|nr:MAG: hypothetical protein C5B60_02465 [Chloroflexota bacterium]
MVGTAGAGTVITTQTEGQDFRMTFKIRHPDNMSSPSAEITVYNLSKSTARDVIHEFDQVVLMAGYMTGHYGIIFKGTIKQYKIGRESAVDSYLKIFASTGDIERNFATSSGTLDDPSWRQRQEVLYGDLHRENPHLEKGQFEDPAPDFLKNAFMPRPYVRWGSAADEMREHARSTQQTWYWEHGQLHCLPSTAYRRGEIIVINPGTGQIGAAEVTQDGIFIKCLLNPNIYVKSLVQLDSRTFNQYFVPGGNQLKGQFGAHWPTRAGIAPIMASVDEDGTYCVMVVDHEGDSRGLPWYSNLVCTNQDPTNPWDASLRANDWWSRNG